MTRPKAAWSARTTREGRDSETRDLLLKCASRVFGRLGYARTTIADIAAEGDVSRATFYVYFASKSDVFLSVAKRVRDDVLAVHEIPGIDLDDAHELARAASAAYLRTHVRNRDLLTVIEHQALENSQISEIWHEIRDRPVGRTTRHIRTLIREGKADPSASALATAHATYGVADRFAELVAAEPELLAQAADDLARIYLRLLGVSTENG